MTVNAAENTLKFLDGKQANWITNDSVYWGVEAEGKIIVPCQYKKLSIVGNMIYCQEKRNAKYQYRCEVYDNKGTLKISENDGYAVFTFFRQRNGAIIGTASAIEKSGVIDENGDYIYIYKVKKDQKGFRYLINEVTDTIVVEGGKYTSIILNRDIIKVKTGSKVGVLELDGSVIIPPLSYASIMPWQYNSEPGFKANKSEHHNGVEAYYNRDGVCVIKPTVYKEIYPLRNGNYAAKLDGYAVILDSIGNLKFSTNYRSIELSKDRSHYIVHIGNGKGKLSLDGKLIETPKATYEEKKITEGDFTYIEYIDEMGNHGVKDLLGNVIIPSNYRFIYYSTYGKTNKKPMFTVHTHDTYEGVCDVKGKMIVPCKYHKAHPYYIGEVEYYEVELNGRYGLCDKNGQECVKPIYDHIYIDDNLKIYVTIGVMEGVIDSKGKMIIPCEYSKVRYEEKTGNYKTELFGYNGICSADGKIIIPPKYTSVYLTDMYKDSPFGEIYCVKDGKTTGYFSKDGQMIFPASLYEHVGIYETDSYDKEYGIKDAWHIVAWNNIEERCYYDFNGNLIYNSSDNKKYDEYFDAGGKEFDKKNYNKAIEYYKKAIEIHKSQAAYFNIGASYYNIDNYKLAITFLKKSQEFNISQETYNRATDLIYKCEQYQKSQKSEHRKQIWQGIVGTAFAIGDIILQTNAALNTYNNTVNTNSLYSTTQIYNNETNSSVNYLVDPSYAMYQVQQQYWNEYLQLTNGGQTMSYQEFMNIKAATYMQGDNHNIDNSLHNNSNNNNVDYSHSDISSKKTEMCLDCCGTGHCSQCRGTGCRTDNMFGLGQNCTKDCGICEGTGKCHKCGGTGRL